MFDWWPARLVDDGYLLRLIAIQGSRKLYRVSPKDEPSQERNANIVAPAAKTLGSDGDPETTFCDELRTSAHNLSFATRAREHG